MIQNIAVRTPEKRHTTITTHCRKLKIMPAVLALQERFNFTSHAESPPLFYIHFFILRADRIIVGEVRDHAAMDMANSMLTGHDGSISTGHGNSAEEMMIRLVTMILMGYDMPVLAIKQQLAAAIDIVVHLGRLRDNSRKVLEISEVTGVEDGEIQLRPIYVFRETGNGTGKVIGKLEREQDLKNIDKLVMSGIWEESLYGNKEL